VCVCCLADVIGIVKSADEIRSLTSKQGRELKKRDLTLVDESQVQIRLTLWANDVSLSRLCSRCCCSACLYHLSVSSVNDCS